MSNDIVEIKTRYTSLNGVIRHRFSLLNPNSLLRWISVSVVIWCKLLL
jgi:hypothetical protein